MQGLPWQVLPFTRSVVKEQLASAAFSSCLGLSFSVSRAAALSTVLASGNWGRSLVLGRHCSGWQEGAVGTLVWQKQGEVSLFQELVVLSSCFNQFSIEQQDSAPVNPVHAIHNHFAQLSISAEETRIAQGGEGAGLMDIKKNL